MSFYIRRGIRPVQQVIGAWRGSPLNDVGLAAVLLSVLAMAVLLSHKQRSAHARCVCISARPAGVGFGAIEHTCSLCLHARHYVDVAMQQTAQLRPRLPSRRRASRALVQAPECYKGNGNEYSSASVTEHVTERRAQELPSPAETKVCSWSQAGGSFLHPASPSRLTCIQCLQDDAFVWSKQWYPLAAVEDLNPSKPFATKLLGKSAMPGRNAASVTIIGKTSSERL